MRVPAALCGVAALRPTVGRTSHAHCPPNAFSIMAVGPLAGCLADALLVHAAIGNAGAPRHAAGPACVAHVPGNAATSVACPLCVAYFSGALPRSTSS